MAGVFWGEGCVSITLSGRRHSLVINVGNTDRELLEMFVTRWGSRLGTKKYTRKRGNIQAAWQWCVTGLRACDVCDALAPFMGGVKREAIEIGRRYRALIKSDSRPVSDALWESREALRQEMKRYTDPLGTRKLTRKVPTAASAPDPAVLGHIAPPPRITTEVA